MSGTTRDRVKRDGHIFRATRAMPRHAGIRKHVGVLASMVLQIALTIPPVIKRSVACLPNERP
jgi:peptidoglycan biosynthesis protein MviN/MurJ (putative lipid II flippase)